MGKGYDYTGLYRIAEDMRTEAGADYLAVSFCHGRKVNILHVVAGLSVVQRNFLEALGVQLEGQEFVVKKGTVTSRVFKEKKTQINDSFYTQLDKLIPRRVADMMQKATRIKRFVDVPVMYKGRIIGEAVYSFCRDFPKSEVVELEETLGLRELCDEASKNITDEH